MHPGHRRYVLSYHCWCSPRLTIPPLPGWYIFCISRTLAFPPLHPILYSKSSCLSGPLLFHAVHSSDLALSLPRAHQCIPPSGWILHSSLHLALLDSALTAPHALSGALLSLSFVCCCMQPQKALAFLARDGLPLPLCVPPLRFLPPTHAPTPTTPLTCAAKQARSLSSFAQALGVAAEAVLPPRRVVRTIWQRPRCSAQFLPVDCCFVYHQQPGTACCFRSLALALPCDVCYFAFSTCKPSLFALAVRRRCPRGEPACVRQACTIQKKKKKTDFICAPILASICTRY
jgi:hypothetical protein